MKKITTLFIVCICLTVNAQWQQSGGPEGIGIQSLSVLDNGTIINKNNVNILGYSTDDGDTWQQATLNGIPSDDRISLGKFAFPANSILLYSFDYDRIYRSTDNGNNWTESNAGIPLPVTAISLFTFNDTVYLKVSDGFYKSGDDGQGWTKQTISGSKLNVNTIISNNVWVSPGSGGIYYSEDQGQNWQQSSGDVGNTYTFTVAKYNGKLFAISTNKVYISEDDGKSWITTDNQDRGDIRKLRAGAGKLFGLSSESGIYEIDATGTVFTQLDNGLTQPRINDLLSSGNILIAATPVGIYRSGNAGNSWSRANKGIGYSTVYQFASIDSMLFAATSSGVWRSKSYGQRWVPMNTPDIKFNSVIAEGTDLYAACEQGVYKSTDKGASFKLIGSGFPVLVDPVIETNGTDLFLTAYQGSDNGSYVLKSFSGSWSKISSVPGGVHIWVDPSNSNIYIGKYYSDDNGSSWSSVSGLGQVGHVYSYNRFDGKVYAGVFEKINGKPFLFVSENGTAFSSFTSGIDSKAQTTHHVVYGDSLIVDADIAGGNSIIYYKTSADVSFSEYDNSGLPDNKVEPIYSNEYSLFVGSMEGIYRYDLKTLPEVSDTVDQIEYPPVSSLNKVSNNGKSTLHLFPNPVTEWLTIQSAAYMTDIGIYSLTGKKVMQLKPNKNEAVLDVSKLHNGVYILQVMEGNGKFSTRKIIKQ